ncbi:MAG: glycosyltransferase, partial [Candidatus Sumerlaeia bacterium]|nr:glycosyltransferase [Candidatus Sumerlaeia bacterium]
MSSARKLKVIWTYRRFGVGGSETSALSVLPKLLQHFDITILLTSGVGMLVPQARALGIPVVKADMKGKLNRQRIVQGARFIASLKPDIIHIHSFDNHFMVRIAAILAKVPIIVTHHHTLPSSRYTPKLLRYEIKLLPATDCCLFVSKAGYTQYWELVKDRCEPQQKERLHI